MKKIKQYLNIMLYLLFIILNLIQNHNNNCYYKLLLVDQIYQRL